MMMAKSISALEDFDRIDRSIVGSSTIQYPKSIALKNYRYTESQDPFDYLQVNFADKIRYIDSLLSLSFTSLMPGFTRQNFQLNQ